MLERSFSGESSYLSFNASSSQTAINNMPGSSAGLGKEKPQITIHTSMAHHLATRLLLKKQSSLDDRQTQPQYVKKFLFF